MARMPRTATQDIERMRNLLAFLLVGSFISVLPVLTFRVIPEANKDIVTYIIGQLSGMATMALGFYFVNKVGQDALDAKRADTTRAMADAVSSSLSKVNAVGDAGKAADDVAEAAVDKAAEISGEKPAPKKET